MPFLSIVSFPSVSSTLSTITSYANPFFTEFQDFMWWAIGISVALGALIFLPRIIHNAMHGRG